MEQELDFSYQAILCRRTAGPLACSVASWPCCADLRVSSYSEAFNSRALEFWAFGVLVLWLLLQFRDQGPASEYMVKLRDPSILPALSAQHLAGDTPVFPELPQN